MLEVGQPAPDFSATAADGSPFRLSSLRGRPVVLYFFPKANSPGCRREAEGFTAAYPGLVARDHAVVGVSIDSVDSEEKFRKACDIPFPLVADPDGAIARRYGVVGFLGLAKRVTFLLDRDLRVVDVIEGMLPGPHVRRAVEWAGRGPAR